MPSIGNATAQKWKYNDREFEALHGLNVNEMNFRQYDPALGRFGGIDALAGYMPSINPYQFGFNNPVYFSDPTGLLPGGGDGDGGGDDEGILMQEIVINGTYNKPHYEGLSSIPHLTYHWGKPNRDGSPARTGGGGDPPYIYNSVKYESKTDLYFAILYDKFKEQFGIKDVLALAAGLDNKFPSIPKRFTTPGASSKTSYASKYASKMFPQKMPFRLPTHFNKANELVLTKVFGRFLGRALGPIGWAMLAYDIGMTFYNTQVIYDRIVN